MQKCPFFVGKRSRAPRFSPFFPHNNGFSPTKRKEISRQPMGKRLLFQVFSRIGGRVRRKNIPPECPQIVDFEARGNPLHLFIPFRKRNAPEGILTCHRGRSSNPREDGASHSTGRNRNVFQDDHCRNGRGRNHRTVEGSGTVRGKHGEVDCHLIDEGILIIYTDRSVTISHPPLKFNPDGRPEDRRIFAREALEARG